MTSKIQVGDIVRVTIEGEVGYVGNDGKGFDFKHVGQGRTPSSVRLDRDGVSVEVIRPVKSAVIGQFEALRVGAGFQVYNAYGQKHGGVRIKTSDTTYYNIDYGVEYDLSDYGNSLSGASADHLVGVAL